MTHTRTHAIGRLAAALALALGLEDNVAEWTATDYTPGGAKLYQTAPPVAPLKVVRGATWDDKLRIAPTTFRWRYPHCQPVYNVGFRVICEAPEPKVATKE